MANPAEIRTDEYGVSHVHASDRRSLAFAQGYVQARDRLFQLDVLRHVAHGNSAAVLGPDQLPSDVQVRRDLYSERTLRRLLNEVASERTRVAFEGFADGVNRAMVEMIRERDIPAEFLPTGHVPERWRPVDSAAIATYMLGYFGVSGGTEFENAIRFARLCESLGERQAWTAYGDLNRRRVPDDHDASLARRIDGGEERLDFADVPDQQLEFARAAAGAEPWGVDARDAPELTGLRDAQGVTAGVGFGSNAVAVSGRHTETEAPLLFGGPQMGYYRPPVIHEIGLHAPHIDAVGVSVVGVPSIVIGRTPEFAWSITSGFDDMIDTVAVRLHPDDRHRYEWDGEFRRMDTERVTHRPSVLGALLDRSRPRRVTQERAFIREDDHVMPVIAWNPDTRVAWAQRTTTRGNELAGIEAMMGVPEADSIAAAAESLAELPFSFNYLFADAETIRYVHAGRVPERDPEFDWRLPAPGRDGLWEGTSHTVRDYGMDETDPDRGFVFQWNNAPAPGWRAGDREQQWGRIHRGDALRAAVEEALADGPVSFEDVRGLIERAGRYDAVARHTAPFIVEAGRASGDEQVSAAADVLASWVEAGYPWSTSDDTHHPGMRIWEAVREELQTMLFEGTLDELAPDVEYDPPRSVPPGTDRTVHAGSHGVTHRGDVLLARIFAGDAEHDWFGGDPDEATREAFERAVTRLANEFESDDPAAWRLPERTVKFDPMGALPELDVPIVNRGTYNLVVSPAEDRGVSVLPPANSGHVPLSAFRSVLRGDLPSRLADQVSLYETFDFKPLSLELTADDSTLRDRTTLECVPPIGPAPRLRALFDPRNDT